MPEEAYVRHQYMPHEAQFARGAAVVVELGVAAAGLVDPGRPCARCGAHFEPKTGRRLLCNEVACTMAGH